MDHAALIPCQLDQLAECRGSRSVVARGSVLVWRNTALKLIACAPHTFARCRLRMPRTCSGSPVRSPSSQPPERSSGSSRPVASTRCSTISDGDAKSSSRRGDCAERLVEFANKEVEPTIRQGNGAAIGVAQRRDHVENAQKAALCRSEIALANATAAYTAGASARGIGAVRTIRWQAVASITSQAPPGLLIESVNRSWKTRRTFETHRLHTRRSRVRRCASSPSLRRCELRIARNPPACAISSAGNSW